jgi:hypothetical protein
MAEQPDKRNETVETAAGVCVVLLATLLGICNVKDGNIVQSMQATKAEEFDKYAYYQARKLRKELAEATADVLLARAPGDTETFSEPADSNPASEARTLSYAQARGERAARHLKTAARQLEEMKKLLADADECKARYATLSKQDDQFDLCEASLAIALALFGVTILLKRWWMFVVALFPAALGIAMGLAGFLGWETETMPVISQLIQLIT